MRGQPAVESRKEPGCRPTSRQGCTSRKSPREHARCAGVGTAIAAFVGLAEAGPFNRPTLVSNWTQFTNTFGGFVAGSYLAQSVYGYFMNGGGNCYIVRIGQDPGPSGPAPRSSRAKELAAARPRRSAGSRRR